MSIFRYPPSPFSLLAKEEKKGRGDIYEISEICLQKNCFYFLYIYMEFEVKKCVEVT